MKEIGDTSSMMGIQALNVIQLWGGGYVSEQAHLLKKTPPAIADRGRGDFRGPGHLITTSTSLQGSDFPIISSQQ